jgi:hypothetical protein
VNLLSAQAARPPEQRPISNTTVIGQRAGHGYRCCTAAAAHYGGQCHCRLAKMSM